MSVRPERAINWAGCSVACLERLLWELGFKLGFFGQESGPIAR